MAVYRVLGAIGRLRVEEKVTVEVWTVSRTPAENFEDGNKRYTLLQNLGVHNFPYYSTYADEKGCNIKI